MTPKEANALASLHRYFIWANRMRTHFDKLILETGLTTGQSEIEARLYMSYWYGGLYVVTEGWEELKLSDPVIDGLLDSPNLSLLKRFRNGTFHFQSDYNDTRFTELVNSGVDVVSWVRDLHRNFGRYFLRALHKVNGSLPSNR